MKNLQALHGAAAASGPSHSMTRGTTRLLLIGLVALALLPPLFTAIAGVLLERHEASAAASSLAWTISRHRAEAQGVSLQSLLASGAEDASQWREALAADGAVLAEAGRAKAPSHLLISATVSVAGPGPVAAVRVCESLLTVLLATALAAALSLGATGLTWLLVVRRSVGALRKAEGRLRSINVIDPLTGLLNRAGLRQRLQRGLDAERQASERRVGVLLIDLDRFRLINESLGQGAGDQLLRAVAARIRGVLHGSDAAARLGGDQMVPRLGAAFDGALFRQRFEDKGRFAGYLAAVPTWLITAATPALTGVARALDTLPA